MDIKSLAAFPVPPRNERGALYIQIQAADTFAFIGLGHTGAVTLVGVDLHGIINEAVTRPEVMAFLDNFFSEIHIECAICNPVPDSVH